MGGVDPVWTKVRRDSAALLRATGCLAVSVSLLVALPWSLQGLGSPPAPDRGEARETSGRHGTGHMGRRESRVMAAKSGCRQTARKPRQERTVCCTVMPGGGVLGNLKFLFYTFLVLS